MAKGPEAKVRDIWYGWCGLIRVDIEEYGGDWYWTSYMFAVPRVGETIYFAGAYDAYRVVSILWKLPKHNRSGARACLIVEECDDE